MNNKRDLQLFASQRIEGVEEGAILWEPSPEFVESTSLKKYMDWLCEHEGKCFGTYAALWKWSITDLEGFWGSLWNYFKIESSEPYTRVLSSQQMPGADWFPGARLNYAENILKNERSGKDALFYLSETTQLHGMSWAELGSKVRVLATYMRAQGIQPGDRVVSYMPNIPETVIAMLATTSIGAIWSSCSPDFGSDGVLDRVSQLEPQLIFVCDGYSYGGKAFDRRNEVARMCDRLPDLFEVIYLPRTFGDSTLKVQAPVSSWDEIMERPPVARENFVFEQVGFSHPLWILFSSGTTGNPKAIVHGHGGILLEQLKVQHFHMDYRPGDVAFFYSTTGWMMWNSLVSSLLSDVCPVLYDGNPSYPDVDILWRMVEDSKANLFGASPSFVEIMRREGVVPRERYDLSSLRTVMPAGSIVSPECNAWFYQNVHENVWVATGSGGTDICTGLVGGVPILPVRAGEIQAPSLGVAVAAFDESGNSLVNEVGELVITKPMPSMPIYLWGDKDNERYKESYFDKYPGIWRHGDFFKINEHLGCYVLGRSDATLNRYGIRIGTAEIYRALESIPEVADALIVNLDLPGGKFFMPLFVTLKNNMDLTDEIEQSIRHSLRTKFTPRHVPDTIHQVKEIPTTLTGKKMEVPVRKILMGVPVDRAANLSAMKNPESINYFVDYAENKVDCQL